MRRALSFVSRTCQRAQGSVEYGLVLVGGALLAVLGYTLFSPIVRDAATQIGDALGRLH